MISESERTEFGRGLTTGDVLRGETIVVKLMMRLGDSLILSHVNVAPTVIIKPRLPLFNASCY